MIVEDKGKFKIVTAEPGKRITTKNRDFFKTYIYVGPKDDLSKYEEVGEEVWGPLEANKEVKTVKSVKENKLTEVMLEEIAELRILVNFLLQELIHDKYPSISAADFKTRVINACNNEELFELLGEYNSKMVMIYQELFNKHLILLGDIPEPYRNKIK